MDELEPTDLYEESEDCEFCGNLLNSDGECEDSECEESPYFVGDGDGEGGY